MTAQRRDTPSLPPRPVPMSFRFERTLAHKEYDARHFAPGNVMTNEHLRTIPSREHLFHGLSEAAELEHCLMCTYLYAAFSLRTDEADGLNALQLDAVRRWRQTILEVANEEMGHLIAVWNISSALGSAPRLGRANFPLDPGLLPAGLVVRLAPFNRDTLQHFIFLERPTGSSEPDSAAFAPELN